METIETNLKKIRLLELLLILACAYIPPFFSAVVVYLGFDTVSMSRGVATISFINGLMQSLTALAVLSYILFRQGRNYSTIGFSFQWKDIFRGLGILLLTFLGLYILTFSINLISYLFTHNVPNIQAQNIELFKSKITIWFLIFLFVNAFFEELIFRAYLITELEGFISTPIAIVISVFLQTSYHIYQGFAQLPGIALVFLIYSLYYTKKRRVLPVILAHLFMDLFAVLMTH